MTKDKSCEVVDRLHEWAETARTIEKLKDITIQLVNGGRKFSTVFERGGIEYKVTIEKL